MGVKGYLEVGLITAIPYAVAVVGMVFPEPEFRPQRGAPVALCVQRDCWGVWGWR